MILVQPIAEIYRQRRIKTRIDPFTACNPTWRSARDQQHQTVCYTPQGANQPVTVIDLSATVSVSEEDGEHFGSNAHDLHLVSVILSRFHVHATSRGDETLE